MLLVLTLWGCDPNGTIKTGDSGTSETGEPWWVEDIDPDAEPEVESGTVGCSSGSNSSGDLFFAKVQVHDPNGNDTLQQLASRIVMENGGSEIFDEPLLVCDGSPYCEGSWRSGDYGQVACSSGSSYEYFAIIIDRDGNESDAFELEWE